VPDFKGHGWIDGGKANPAHVWECDQHSGARTMAATPVGRSSMRPGCPACTAVTETWPLTSLGPGWMRRRISCS